MAARRPRPAEEAAEGVAEESGTALRHVTIHGHRVAYRQAGTGPLVVLVHGIAESSATFSAVMPALAEHHQVIAVDLLGHGASAKPRGDYSLGAYASGLRDVLTALDHPTATIVGHSLGGGVAMQFAYQFPERCERLVLVSSGGLGKEVSPWLRLLAGPGVEYVLPLVLTRHIHGPLDAVARWFGRFGLRPDPVLAEVWATYRGLTDAQAQRAFLQTVRSVIDVAGQRVSAGDRLYLAAEVPTMIVWGERDTVIPVAHAHAAHALIPGSRLEVLEGVGHFLPVEAPDRLARLIEDFVATTEPTPVTPERWRQLLTAPVVSTASSDLTGAARAELDAADAYLDAAPRTGADTVDVGPFTLFVGRSAWAYYARPRRPPGVPITAGDLDELAAACATRAVPLEIEWICELHPSFEAVATGAGLEVRTHALMAIEPRAVASGPPGGADLRVGGPAAGVTVRVVGADEPALMAGRAVADVSFGHGGTAVGAPGPAERDAAAAGIRAAFVEHLQARARSGETVTVVAETDRGVVAVGSYQPVGVVAEVVGVATLPSERRRGLGAAVTRALLDHAAAAGITSVLLSAQDEAVERLYRSVGFRRIGTTGAAAAPAP